MRTKKFFLPLILISISTLAVPAVISQLIVLIPEIHRKGFLAFSFPRNSGADSNFLRFLIIFFPNELEHCGALVGHGFVVDEGYSAVGGRMQGAADGTEIRVVNPGEQLSLISLLAGVNQGFEKAGILRADGDEVAAFDDAGMIATVTAVADDALFFHEVQDGFLGLLCAFPVDALGVGGLDGKCVCFPDLPVVI